MEFCGDCMGDTWNTFTEEVLAVVLGQIGMGVDDSGSRGRVFVEGGVPTLVVEVAVVFGNTCFSDGEKEVAFPIDTRIGWTRFPSLYSATNTPAAASGFTATMGHVKGL